MAPFPCALINKPQRSSSRLRPPRSLRMTPIDSFKQIAELRRRDDDRTVRRRGPDEASPFQPLGVERHTRPSCQSILIRSPLPSTEGENVARVRIALQRLLDLKRETVHATSHVGRTGGESDPNS